MRINFRVTLAVTSVCVLLGIANSALAASIGSSFIGRGGGAGATMQATDLAGVIPQTFWNNINSGDPNYADGTSSSLLDDVGNFTSVKIIYDAGDSWSSGGGTATPNERLMKGIIKVNPEPDTAPINGSETMTFVVTNLPAGTYNVIVYLMENDADPNNCNPNCQIANINVTLGSTTYYVQQQHNFTAVGSFMPATSTTVGLYSDANYAGFTNVTAAGNGTITFTGTKQIDNPQTTDGAGIAGIQIIKLTGAAFGVNTETCSITANPASPGFAVDGGTPATFTVGTQGPCKVQWTKNNVPIPGAINATLVYNAVLADDNAQIRAVVYNNVNTNTSAPATLFVDPNTPPALTQGFFKVDRWEGIGANTAQLGLDDVKTNIAGAVPPTASYYINGPNAPDTGLINFGARVSGWIKPDVTGDYDFFIRSDDSSALYLNSTNATSGTNTLPDVNVASPICTAVVAGTAFAEPPAAETTVAPIHLEAGKLYGFVAIYKEAGGGDMVQVAWRKTGDPTPAASLKPIAPYYCWTLASGAGTRADITTQPVDKTVFEGRTASFNFAVATIPVAGVYAVQWFTNGGVIPNATSGGYVTPPTTLSQSNTAFRAVGYTLRGPLTSSVAILKVLVDTNPPVPSFGAITKSTGGITVGVSFDEAINPADMVAGNFSLIGGTGTVTFPTNTFGDYTGILFDPTSLSPGGSYTGRVANVRDLKGNAISAGGVNIPFTVGKVGWDNSGTPIRPGQVIPVGGNGFDILNGGRGEWGTYDEITIAYLKKTNDFDVKVQVVYAEPGSQWTRVGLSARNNLNVGEPASDRTNTIPTAASAYAQTHVNPNQTLWSANRIDPTGLTPVNATSNNGHEQNARLDTGIATTGWGTTATSPVYPDVWLRMRRTGDTIEGFRGEDGANWISQGTIILTNQQPDMFVGPTLCFETANMWSGTDHDVWGGPFDPKFDRLIVAQFRNFGNAVPPTLSIAQSGANAVITYTGTLVSSSSLDGPWLPVGGAVSPYSTPATGAPKYFRAQE